MISSPHAHSLQNNVRPFSNNFMVDYQIASHEIRTGKLSLASTYVYVDINNENF